MPRALVYLLMTVVLAPVAFFVGYAFEISRCNDDGQCGVPLLGAFLWAVGAVVLMVVVVFANEIRLTKEPRD